MLMSVFFTQGVFAAVPTFTASIKAKDGSTDKILLTFSEPVSTTTGSAGQPIVAGDLAVAGGDGLTISALSHVANSKSVVLTMSANMNLSATTELTIACATDAIYDNGGANACTQGATDIYNASVDTTGPTVSTIHWLDSAGDGDIDKAEVQFSEAIDDSTLANADFEFDNNATNNALGEETVSGGGTAVVSIGSVNLVDDEYYFLTVTTGIAGTDSANLHLIATNTTDLLGNAILMADKVGTSIDKASPVVMTAETLDVGDDGTTHNGKVDHLKLTFSENIDDSGIANYAAGADYAPQTSFVANVTNENVDAVEILGDAEDDNILYIIFDEDAGACDATTFTGCDTDTVDQDITLTGATVTITDSSGNVMGDLVSGDVIESDTAAPYILGSNYYDDNDDGVIDHLVVIFSEPVSDLSYIDISSTISAGGTLTTTALVAAGTIPLDAAGNDRWITLAIASGTANTTAIISTFDTAGTGMIDDANANDNLYQATVAMADEASPIVVTWNLDMQSRIMTLNFSETVDASTLAVGSVTIQDAASQTTSYTLTNSTTSSGNGGSIIINLSDTDWLAIRNDSLLAVDQASSYLSITATAIDDMNGNDLIAILNTAGLNASSYVRKSSGGGTKTVVCLSPKIVSFFPNENTEKLSKIWFNVSPQQNSSIWSNFNQAKSEITVKVGGVEVPLSNINLSLGKYIIVTATLDTPIETAGNVNVFISVPSMTTKEVCYTEETHTVSITEHVDTPSSNSIITTSRFPNMKRFVDVVSKKKKFKDISIMDWERPFVDKVSAAGIMTGYADGSGEFGKDDEVTNAQLVKVGLESFGYELPTKLETAPFLDVKVNEWFAPYLQKAKELGSIPKVVNGKIKPNSSISRGETMELLIKMAGIDLSEVSGETRFADVSSNRSFAKSIAWATENGIVSGYENKNQFGPFDSLSRGQLAKIIVNFLEFLDK